MQKPPYPDRSSKRFHKQRKSTSVISCASFRRPNGSSPFFGRNSRPNPLMLDAGKIIGCPHSKNCIRAIQKLINIDSHGAQRPIDAPTERRGNSTEWWQYFARRIPREKSVSRKLLPACRTKKSASKIASMWFQKRFLRYSIYGIMKQWFQAANNQIQVG